MADLNVSFNVECEVCGDDLQAHFKNGLLIVTPCERCLSDSYDEGYDAGEHDSSDYVD